MYPLRWRERVRYIVPQPREHYARMLRIYEWCKKYLGATGRFTPRLDKWFTDTMSKIKQGWYADDPNGINHTFLGTDSNGLNRWSQDRGTNKVRFYDGVILCISSNPVIHNMYCFSYIHYALYHIYLPVYIYHCRLRMCTRSSTRLPHRMDLVCVRHIIHS